ncbi:unnamed protein product [Closterium sp. NIES-54]
MKKAMRLKMKMKVHVGVVVLLAAACITFATFAVSPSAAHVSLPGSARKVLRELLGDSVSAAIAPLAGADGTENGHGGSGSAEVKEACEEIYGLLPCSSSVPGSMFLMAAYGYLVLVAAQLISEGSELLLQVLDPGLIGGLLLPVLGALPDTLLILVRPRPSLVLSHALSRSLALSRSPLLPPAIVRGVFENGLLLPPLSSPSPSRIAFNFVALHPPQVSGLGGTKEEAQDQVLVGMGVLAGCTIMILTIAWGGSLVCGHCERPTPMLPTRHTRHRAHTPHAPRPKEEAQDQVLVGMGVLAGSTIMILTIAWGGSLICGRCDLIEKPARRDSSSAGAGAAGGGGAGGSFVLVAKDRTLTRPYNWYRTGVTTDEQTRIGAWIMMGSVVPFIIMQIPLMDGASGKYYEQQSRIAVRAGHGQYAGPLAR